ncbi:beta-1,6-N-acetylglucosaminyltransferase [Rosenbergiella australiborealis]|uniref:beta-1,6-N-acetylglucosaminyltransferase n=1 Tax=Rosenbergiella australiborealis TaxID=1544696 RepID=UPI001F4D8D77|nr:beta-1,6-N-acetylglucosaminyltransferase [Rosenbergiella australiborealis]
MKKTAVLIQAHNNIDYIFFLSKKFENVNFYVHMDKKNNKDNDLIDKLTIPNLFKVTEPINVNWGGFSQVQATLKLIDLAYGNKENKYFHFISAECVPLLDFDEISFFWESEGLAPRIQSVERNDIYWRLNIRVPYSDTPYLRTVPCRVLNQLFKFIGSKIKLTNIPKDLYSYGSNWFSIAREHIIEIKKLERDGFFSQFYNISCADEHVFQAFFKKINIEPNSNKRFLTFPLGKSSPKYLEIDDILLAKKEGFWFARKVRSDIAMEFINEKL